MGTVPPSDSSLRERFAGRTTPTTGVVFLIAFKKTGMEEIFSGERVPEFRTD